jgi:hypothetical protein
MEKHCETGSRTDAKFDEAVVKNSSKGEYSWNKD